MKPVRGSNRAASKAPNTKPKKKKTEQTKKKATEQQDLQPAGSDLGKTSQPKAAQKRKAGSPSLHKKVKSQENWKQMSRSSIVALENIMDLAILSTLVLSQREKKEIQEHLNILKQRFIAHCEQLKVPVNKQIQYSSHRHQDETKKSEFGQKALSSLEENLKSVLISLEKTEEETVALEDRCRTLRGQLEEQEQEEEAKEMFQIAEQAVLNLSPLPPPKSETTLEARMKKIIPAADAETMARKLGGILQNAKAIQDAQELLLQAHKHADQLFKP